MGALDDRAAAILQLLFDAPGDAGWRALLRGARAAISPDVRVVLLAEAGSRAVHRAVRRGGQRRRPGLLPRRRGGKQRIDAPPAGTAFELPPLGASDADPVVQRLLQPEGLLAGPASGWRSRATAHGSWRCCSCCRSTATGRRARRPQADGRSSRPSCRRRHSSTSASSARRH